ncbi:class D beta-lactamase [Sphingomonas canadensis]|uniref:Beta-lactamase n=1 Tax=Sphingomonas canadensis TaxID=1219257 RepID=A0ABW3HEX4_9SPHN|nr:class D beta-lactamase [Sphingomonas canadensis]MCW3837768.1 class D beta-lactamase [Sphingomonas canadensis]
MTLDRRTFTRTALLAAGAGIAGFPNISNASSPAPRIRATVIADAATGRILHRTGECTARFGPCSTFKIPLALMGYDAGILIDAHRPAWDYRPEIHRASRAADKQRTDPTSWEGNSVLWYSREITARLGMARFQSYIDRFGYGNRDLRGNPGKNDGLVNSWLMSSLLISPDEQLQFVRRMLAHRLVSPRAHAMTEAILPQFDGAGGWRVHGKTGSGSLKNANGVYDDKLPLGWFVGWADKATAKGGKRRVVFARLMAGTGMPDGAGGPNAREWMLREIARLAG